MKKEPFTLIFEDVAAHFPEKTAIYWINSSNGFEAMSYEQLNRKANRLSWYLKSVCRSTNGVNIVAVCMDRTPNYLISLLAIWKAGFVYQPLDNQAEYTLIQERLSQAQTTYLLLDRGSKMKLGSLTLNLLHSCIEDLEQIFPGEKKCSQNPPNLSQLDDPAYLIASSGTTGRPKMIMNTFEGLPGRLNGFLKHIHLDVNSCVLGFSGYVFDASLMDIMIALGTGSAILIVPSSVQKDIAGKLTALLVSAKEKNINISYAALIPDVIELIDPNLFLFNHLITMGDKAHWPSLRKL
ncbi:MAG: AMP-binding protein, partial [Tatlockia sp.]|nr:AMP-binding protein [Tatlockia sp.]